jgi:iron complex transport system permease protein
MGYALSSNRARAIGIAVGGVLLLLCLFSSIILGATKISLQSVIDTYTHYDEGVNEQVIVQTSRTPRTLVAAAVGASLAIAGALIQAITRNVLAEPNILGINYGASFFVVFAVTVWSVSSMESLMWVSFLGAALGAATVYILGSLGRDGLTPLKMILAGAAISALFSSFTQGMLVLDEQGLNSVLFWLSGSVAGRTMEMLFAVIPYMLLGWVAAFVMARQINVLALGEQAAQGLGQRTTIVKMVLGIVICLLAGGSVALAGPIGFIGIVIPHIARFFGGTDHRWIISYSALLGAILIVLADIAARFVIRPEELPVGVLTAIIGIPFFLYIARRGSVK